MTKRVGNAVIIRDQDDEICELCGKKDECRPYGKRLESGRRMNICFDCGMKDKKETNKAIRELFDV